mmetsp:Transcript_47986/g.99007  ORF Transcript_47986/g.99007 Transcript_47986/m.99007 type:complete len:87 (+) Transcript_47986:578-838(+)
MTTTVASRPSQLLMMSQTWTCACRMCQVLPEKAHVFSETPPFEMFRIPLCEDAKGQSSPRAEEWLPSRRQTALRFSLSHRQREVKV